MNTSFAIDQLVRLKADTQVDQFYSLYAGRFNSVLQFKPLLRFLRAEIDEAAGVRYIRQHPTPLKNLAPAKSWSR